MFEIAQTSMPKRVEVPALSATPGQVIGVLGPNGAGKSSLLEALLDPQADRSLDGRSLRGASRLQVARQIAVLRQSTQLAFDFNVTQVIELGGYSLQCRQAELNQRIQFIAEQLELTDLLNRGVNQLSGGERQRVHLARVLLQLSEGEATRVLMLDERHRHRIYTSSIACCGTFASTLRPSAWWCLPWSTTLIWLCTTPTDVWCCVMVVFAWMCLRVR